jgi:hypothetical protein
MIKMLKSWNLQKDPLWPTCPIVAITMTSAKAVIEAGINGRVTLSLPGGKAIVRC